MASIIRRAATLYLKNNIRSVQTHSATAGPHGDYKIWKKLTFFVGFPAIALGMLNVYLAHKEEEHHERPKFVPYEYLRIRNKRFPWGDGQKSFFHNPKVNALPNGYEDEQ